MDTHSHASRTPSIIICANTPFQFQIQEHVLWIKKLYDEIEDASFRKKKDKVGRVGAVASSVMACVLCACACV